MVKGRREGEYKRYFNNENNSIKVICFLKDDKLHGEYKEYFEDGQLRIQTIYKNGIEQF